MIDIRFEDVAFYFEGIISGETPLAEASRWACEMMRHEDNRELRYIPSADEDRIWCGVLYLSGVDLETNPNISLHSKKDFSEEFERLKASGIDD